MAWTLACVGDLHAGSTLGLHPLAGSALDDGGTYHPTKGQRWLWDKWNGKFWPRVADTRRDRLALLLNGDLVDGGHHHGTTQATSGNMSIQLDILDTLLEPALALKPDLIVITRGTAVHTGASACFEELAAKRLRERGLPVHPHKSTGALTWWHFTAEFGGVLIDMAHHGQGLPKRGWTRKNGANLHAADIFFKHALAKRRCPDLVLRSHIHVHGDSLDNYPVRYIALPAWQLKTEFGHRIAAGGEFADIGGVIAQCEDGNLTVDTQLYPADPAPVEKFA